MCTFMLYILERSPLPYEDSAYKVNICGYSLFVSLVTLLWFAMPCGLQWSTSCGGHAASHHMDIQSNTCMHGAKCLPRSCQASFLRCCRPLLLPFGYPLCNGSYTELWRQEFWQHRSTCGLICSAEHSATHVHFCLGKRNLFWENILKMPQPSEYMLFLN